MERSVSVRTPESIAFYYELAGLGSRFLALAIDMIIQGLVSIVLIILAAVATPRALSVATALHIGSKTFASAVIAAGILIFFIIWFAYFIFFEQIWNGQSPGKRALGIRVVRDGGYPVPLLDSIIRNLVRIIEWVIAFYALSVVSMLLSSQNKRLGDFAAGTIVVRDRAFEVTNPKTWLTGEDAQSPDGFFDIAALSPDEIALAQRYAERRTMLNPAVAQQTAARIAAALRPKLKADTTTLNDDELLVKIAASRRV